MLTIDIQTARRFILGKQGLWPGRRWQGAAGVTQAMTEIEYLQLDPLQIIARSQDIALHSRVSAYAPGDWETAAYAQRGFFDWGGWLATRPMAELPYWRPVMRREREGGPDCDPRIHKSGQAHAAAIAEMRSILAGEGTVSNRDFSAANRKRTDSYRGRKDSSLALYYLWRTGAVMTHHRDNFERIYALAEAVAPAHLLASSSDAESDRFLVLKEISFAGLSRLQRTADAFNRGIPFRHIRQLLAELLAAGDIIEVKVEGWKPIHYALSSDQVTLAEISAGRVPPEWRPLAADTTQEVSFLAPLDPVCARGRAKQLFGFDYVWEVYKPESKRRYGYYTLPILWGDRLVARFDSKLDRPANTYRILGFWLEDEALGQDEAFAAALAAAFKRFCTFLNAPELDASGISEPRLRQQVQAR